MNKVTIVVYVFILTNLNFSLNIYEIQKTKLFYLHVISINYRKNHINFQEIERIFILGEDLEFYLKFISNHLLSHVHLLQILIHLLPIHNLLQSFPLKTLIIFLY